MKKRVLTQLLVILFTGTVVTFGYANWWDEDGPSANPHFTGDTSVTDIYEWTTTTEPNPQIRRARTEAASFSAVAATRIGTKGKGIIGLTVETGSTLTKPDGTNESYSRREISGTTGPPVLMYEDLDDISYTYYNCSRSKSISTSSVGDTYTVQVMGYGTGERWTGGFNIELGIANASLKVTYSDGTKVSFPMSTLSGSASRTIIKDIKMPSGATCERVGCTVFLPRADYHKVNCPERIKVWHGTKACPGSWYTCDSDASCNKVNDHVVECLGPTCFDEIKKSEQENYHLAPCTGTNTCGNPYRSCDPQESAAHRYIGDQGCGHYIHQCVSYDHRYETCPLGPNNETCSYGSHYVCSSHQCVYTWGCGHSTSASGDHSYGTFTCGDSTHVGYKCQESSDHKTYIYNCSTCNAPVNNYECQPHTHASGSGSLPSPTPPENLVECAHRNCTEMVSSRTSHREPCGSGQHYYWPGCPNNTNWWSQDSTHALKTCRYGTCGNTWRRCLTPTPNCSSPNRRGKKCWAADP